MSESVEALIFTPMASFSPEGPPSPAPVGNSELRLQLANLAELPKLQALQEIPVRVILTPTLPVGPCGGRRESHSHSTFSTASDAP